MWFSDKVIQFLDRYDPDELAFMVVGVCVVIYVLFKVITFLV